MKKGTTKKRTRKPLWITIGTAAACLAVGGMIAMNTMNTGITAYAQAEYPQMAKYPNESSVFYDKEWESWNDARSRQLNQPEGYCENLWKFYTDSTRTFLDSDKNSSFSPLNMYMALSALAETCGGSSRQQILDLLNADSIESLRTQAGQVWNANYCNDGAVTSVLANSIWLSDDIKFSEDTLGSLADNYYASAYSGKFGTDTMNQAIKDWLNEQTDGFLEDAVDTVNLDASTIFALYSTVYFRGKWDDEFRAERNSTRTFHAPTGDISAEFMNRTDTIGRYYFGEDYGAVNLPFDTGCRMWLILPDEDKNIAAVLDSGEYMDMVAHTDDYYDSSKSLVINLSVPKFDVSSTADLRDGLSELGVTDIFGSSADFTPICSEECYVGKARQSSRVTIDEEGCTAASFVEIATCGSAMPPQDEMDFVLDRPFVFVLTGMDGQPLFAGTVCQP